jgi:dTDP-4-dehydrorhamnose 3,5-epimerase
MKFSLTPIQGIVLITPQVYGDERGFFLETYRENFYHEIGIVDHFVQDNQSRSAKGVLRGLHYQIERPQAQIVTILRGHIFDVGVDLRPNSPTFGKWYGTELKDTGAPRQLYMAPGIAHGFYVLSDWADLHYKVSRNYDANDEAGLFWNDPTIGIKWPLMADIPLQITHRDEAYPKFNNISHNQLPHDPPKEILATSL